jgi:phosphoglycerate dehydrogenase-like enzyme
VILTGHASASTRLGVERTGAAVVLTLEALLGGQVPPNCLNPEAWTS